MACGALREDGAGRWVAPTRAPNFLFPIDALSKVFRGKFLATLHQAATAGALPRDPAGDARLARERDRALYRHDWVVYAKVSRPMSAEVRRDSPV